MGKRHEITRLEAFNDAVFGFALTLLVVSLEVPHSVEKLKDTMLDFAPFALMFAMIEGAWTVTLNCFLLFVVLFYVYPLKFLTNSLVRPLYTWNGFISRRDRTALKKEQAVAAP